MLQVQESLTDLFKKNTAGMGHNLMEIMFRLILYHLKLKMRQSIPLHSHLYWKIKTLIPLLDLHGFTGWELTLKEMDWMKMKARLQLVSYKEQTVGKAYKGINRQENRQAIMAIYPELFRELVLSLMLIPLIYLSLLLKQKNGTALMCVVFLCVTITHERDTNPLYFA